MNVFKEEDQNRDASRRGGYISKFALVAGAGALAAGITVFDGYYTVGETERGLVYTFSKLDADTVINDNSSPKTDVKEPGIHAKIPFVQSVRKIPVGVNEVTLENVNIYTSDSQDLNATISYQYQIPEASLVDIAKKLPTNASIDSIVQNTILQALKASFGQTEATKVPSTRNEIMKSATANADDLLYRNWKIHVNAINMPNFEFNPVFKEAIANATKMKADAERASQDVEKTKAEAASALAKAEGEANSVRTTADAALYAQQKEADGTLYATQKAAEGQKLLIGVIGNDNAPAYWFTQQWNGVTPAVIGGSNVSVTDLSAAIIPSKAATPAPDMK